MLAGASVIFCSKPEALTTIASRFTGVVSAKTDKLRPQPTRAVASAERVKGTYMRGSFVVENHSGAHDSYSRIGIPYKRFTAMAICLLDQAGKPYFQRPEQ